MCARGGVQEGAMATEHGNRSMPASQALKKMVAAIGWGVRRQRAVASPRTVWSWEGTHNNRVDRASFG
eukprot:scaffold8534_cov125-Isochrysis_galbana.AAC.2